MSGNIDIEALLATSDSDSDFEATGGGVADLEALLEDDSGDEVSPGTKVDLNDVFGSDFSDDDSDDGNNPVSLVKLGNSTQNERPSQTSRDTHDTKRSAVTPEDAPTDVVNTSIPTSKAASKPSDTSANGTVNKASSAPVRDNRGVLSMVTSSQTSSNRGSAGSGTGADGYFGSLEVAGRREQRYFHSGIREISKSLEAKRGLEARRPKTGGKRTEESRGTIKLATMEILSGQLKRNSSYKEHGPGNATCIHVNAKYFIVGTSNGLLLVFDFFQELRQIIGSACENGTRCTSAVTAIDMTPSGSYLICGYVTGELALWDTTAGIILKRVTELHTQRISKLSFLWNVGDNLAKLNGTSEFWSVSADASGAANRGHWKKNMWSGYTTDFDCLIDSSSGGIPSLHVLPAPVLWNIEHVGHRTISRGKDSVVPQGSVSSGANVVAEAYIHDVQLLAFNTLTRTYVVQVSPVVCVLHRWQPPALPEGSIREKCSSLHWSWATRRQYPSLAPRGSDVPTNTDNIDANIATPVLVRAWGTFIEVLSVGPVLVSDKSTNTVKFVFETIASEELSTGGVPILNAVWMGVDRIMAVAHEVAFVLNQHLQVLERCSLVPKISKDILIAADLSQMKNQAVPAAVCAKERFIYVMTSETISRLHLQTWVERADQLVQEGQWLEALALALDEGSSSSTSDHQESYIRRYVDLALGQSSMISGNVRGSFPSLHLQNHLQIVGSVCLEYCLACNSTSLMFNDLYSSFSKTRQQLYFLDELEPYILNGVIKQLPSHVLVDLCEIFAKNQRSSSLERCIVRLHIPKDDLDFTTYFLLKRGIAGGFLYVWAQALKDFAGAFQLQFENLLNFESWKQKPARADTPDVLLPGQVELGYKLLLFIQYAATKRLFPHDKVYDSQTYEENVSQNPIPPQSLIELMRVVLAKEKKAPADTYQKIVPKSLAYYEDALSSATDSNGEITYPYMKVLAKVDLSALIVCLSTALMYLEQIGNITLISHKELITMYTTVFAFVTEISANLSPDKGANKEQDAFFECFAQQICKSALHLPGNIIEGCIAWANRKGRDRVEIEGLMCELVASHFKNSSLSQDEVHAALESNNFWRAALVLARKRNSVQSNIPFDKALSFYISSIKSSSAYASKNVAVLESNKMHIFEFIDLYMETQTDESSSSTASLAQTNAILVKNIAGLASIDMKRSVTVVQTYLAKEMGPVMDACRLQPLIQLNLMKAVVNSIDTDPSRSLSEYMTPTVSIAYIRLLASSSPKEVWSFLTTHPDLSSSNECTDLCREKGLNDATALLLERTGQASQALQLLSTDLTSRLRVAESDIAKQMRGKSYELTSILSKTGEERAYSVMALPHYAPIRHTIECMSGICERNRGETSTEMWYKVVDLCIQEKQALRKAKSPSAELVSLIIVQVLQVLLKAMMVQIPARDVVRRITEGTEGSRFSDFKDILLNMIHSCTQEIRSFTACVNIQNSDSYNELHRKLRDYSKAVHVYASGGRQLHKRRGYNPVTVIDIPPAMNTSKRPTGVVSRGRLAPHGLRRALDATQNRIKVQGFGDSKWSFVADLPCVPPEPLPDLGDIFSEDITDQGRKPKSLPAEALSTSVIDFVEEGIIG